MPNATSGSMTTGDASRAAHPLDALGVELDLLEERLHRGGPLHLPTGEAHKQRQLVVEVAARWAAPGGPSGHRRPVPVSAAVRPWRRATPAARRGRGRNAPPASGPGGGRGRTAAPAASPTGAADLAGGAAEGGARLLRLLE